MDWPSWKILFSDRVVFKQALPLVADCDVGHADMILSFSDREDFNANVVGLRANGISDFTTEKP